MKNILSNKSDRKTVEAFIADPANEFAKNGDGKATGFSQKQQMNLVITLLAENSLLRDDLFSNEEDTVKLMTVIYDLCNGSAARQTMEKAGLLGESVGGKRGADVASMVGRWASKETIG